jgi:bifunctional DNase/RNase
MPQMQLVGVQLTVTTYEPVLVLREAHGPRHLPIEIGLAEATAITMAQQGLRPPQPTTHDLLADVITALDRRLEHVRITEMRERIFFAELVLDGGLRVDARTSDSVALALRVGASIHAEESVLAEAPEAGLTVAADPYAQLDDTVDEVAQFRARLDAITPEDFDEYPEA